MIVGFSKHGKGRAHGVLDYLLAESSDAGALNYLLGEKNRAGVLRSPQPVVVRGDPAITQKLIDSSPFTWRYTSGVLSFSAGERITPEMEQKIIAEFESAAFAGLAPDQYCTFWIRHAHTGREELHFVVPRIELTTGKSLNIAPPGKASRQLFDSFRSKINAEYGLSDPDDPARRRGLSLPASVTKLNKQPCQLAASARVRHTINQCVVEKVQSGAVRNRADVVRELTAAGFRVVRQGRDYLSVLQPLSGKRFRLRGEYYRADWSPLTPQRPFITPDADRARVYSVNVARLSQKRAEFNLQRYGQVASAPSTVPAYDRTGNPSPQRPQTFGGAITPPRSAVSEHAGRFIEAAERWSRTDRDLELATGRIGQANRAFANGFESALMFATQPRRRVVSSYEYPAPVQASAPAAMHDRDPGFEPEMEIDFP